jgi:hypothetical protein
MSDGGMLIPDAIDMRRFIARLRLNSAEGNAAEWARIARFKRATGTGMLNAAQLRLMHLCADRLIKARVEALRLNVL